MLKSKDIVHLNLSTTGASQVGADLLKIKNSINDLEYEAKKIEQAIRDQKSTIAATRKEISGYNSDISKQQGIADKNAEAAAKWQTKMTDLENAGKSGGAEWTRYNEKMNANLATMQDAQAKVTELKQARDRSTASLADERKALGHMQNNLKDNTNALAQNKNAYIATAKQMKITEMSANQLRAKASELRRELDNTSKALDPVKWNKLNKELIDVEKQQDKVTAGGNKVKSMFDNLGVTVSKTLSLMVAYKALQFFQDLIGKAADWIKAAPEVAAKTEGISKAFGKLNNRNLLSTLRTETKGLISDMLLMQSSVKADRFGIPINNLAKYLKFAQQRAQETGESIDYLTESIINGIGRKSPLILDNLGISAARLKAEMAGGASIAQATTKIVEEELKKQGNLTLTTADKAQQASVKWENAQVKLGKSMTWLSNIWSDLSGRFADSLSKMIGDTRTANQVLDDHMAKMTNLRVNVSPLIDKYEDMSKKVKLTYGNNKELTKEQQNLVDVIKQIITVIPSAAGNLDQYGRVISLNTTRAREYIKVQKVMLQAMYKSAIQESAVALVEWDKILNELNKKKAEGGETVVDVSTNSMSWGTKDRFRKFNDDDWAKLNADIEEASTKRQDALERYKALNGNWLDEQGKVLDAQEKQRNEFNVMEKYQLKAWIDDERNAKNEYLSIAKEIYQARFGVEYGDTTETKVSKQRKELETDLNNLESAHKTELQKLRETQIIKKQTDEQFKIETAKSDKKYYASRIKLLEDYKKKVSDKNFISDIDKKITDTKSQEIEIDPVIDSATLADLAKNRDILLRGIEIARNENIRALESLELSEEQHAVRVQSIDLSSAQTRLEKLKDYHKEVQNATITDAKLKEDTVRESGAAVVAEELDVINKRKAMEKSFFESNRAAREKFGVITSKEQMDYEKALLQQQMLAGRMSYETYQQGLTAINEKYEKQRIQVREQYGIASQQELYDMELQELVKARDVELWTEEEFEKAKWQLKLKYATQFTQKINTLSSTASSLVSALMEAETAKLDAEYDVRIEAAKNNSKETERLENEKAQKKLDIEKKYADVQFAVKASDIIANTAVAIMTGYAQLGPVMGTIAAAMLGVTGAAQLAAANAEREKVKGMTLGGSSESSKSYSRVITGKEEGGCIDVTRAQDGKQFSAKYDPQKRGFVDRPTVIVGEGPAGSSREWVASNALLRNPTAGSIISLFDEVQRSGQINTIDLNPLIRARMAGLDGGGFIDNRASQSMPVSNNIAPDGTPDNDSLAPLLSQLYEILEYYKYNRIRADVNIREFNEKQDRLNQSQNLGKAL